VSYAAKPGPARRPGQARRRARRRGRPGPARYPHRPRLRLRQAILPLPRRPAHPARGPYAEWTRKIGGKTVTRRLTPAELAAWQPLFDNAKKIRALLAKLQDLTLAIVEATPPQE
jgi:Family of unknown function (DUF6788)